MIRYRYNQQTKPPAPFVYGTFRNPADSTELRDVPGQIDTGADRTVLPDHLVEALGLAQIGRIAVGGLGGVVQHLPTYAVQVAIHQFPAQTIKVVASSGELWVILGRDILNNHRLHLDGPHLTLENGLISNAILASDKLVSSRRCTGVGVGRAPERTSGMGIPGRSSGGGGW